MIEYENDRWRIISSKVGSGFSPAACREKANELDGGEPVEDDDQEQNQSAYGSSQLGAGPSDPSTTYQ
jgi:hypothetical protein